MSIILTKENFKKAFKTSLPLIVGYIPTSFICGVLLQSTGFSVFQTVLMTAMIYAGGSQFMAASMIATNASILSIVISTFIVNFRNSLYSFSLSTHVEEKSIPKLMLMGHLVTDASYAVNNEEYESGNWNDDLNLIFSVIIYIYWILGGLAGGLFGNIIDIPQDIATFSLISMFIVLAVMQITTRIRLTVAIFSFIISIFIMSFYKGSFNIVIVALIGATLGYFLDWKGDQYD